MSDFSQNPETNNRLNELLGSLAQNAVSVGEKDSGALQVDKTGMFLSITGKRLLAPNDAYVDITTREGVASVSVRAVKQSVQFFTPSAQALIDRIIADLEGEDADGNPLRPLAYIGNSPDWSKIERADLKRCKFSRKDRERAGKLLTKLRNWQKKSQLDQFSTAALPVKAQRVEAKSLPGVATVTKAFDTAYNLDEQAQADHAKANAPKTAGNTGKTTKVSTPLSRLQSDLTRWNNTVAMLKQLGEPGEDALEAATIKVEALKKAIESEKAKGASK